MHRLLTRRYVLVDTAIVVVVAVLVGVLTSSGAVRRRPQSVVTLLAAGRLRPGRAIPDGFLGLSLEYPAVEAYAGDDPAALDPVFVQLVRNLAPSETPVLRIGGDSSDWSWWRVPGFRRPPGVSFTITPRWLAVARALTASLRARLILGLNLAAGSPVLAAREAAALIAALGLRSIRALELGNEPELYGRFPWYRTAGGKPVTARPASYDFAHFAADFRSFATALPQAALAGPAFGSFTWIDQFPRFLDAEPKLGLVTLHRYPLQSCFIPPQSPRYPTIANLLAPAASAGLAGEFEPLAALARKHRLPLRVDELNTVSCGAVPAVSRPFASALWVLDALFEMVRAGVAGVNIHTFPGAGYELFSFTRADGRWRGAVAAEYYGLLMFAQAAPAGSRLLAVSGELAQAVQVWATLGRDDRIRVVFINKDPLRAELVALRAPGGFRTGQLRLLRAPNVRATNGVTLAGQTFGAATYTGVPAGHPRVAAANPSGGRYLISLPSASAALLTLAR